MEFEAGTCVVTGAASGIGRAVAARLLRDGTTVVAVDRDEAGLGTLADRGAAAVVADLATAAGRAAVAEACPRPTHLVNAAGVIHLSPLEGVDEAQWDETFAVNARGHFAPSRTRGRAGACA